MKFIPETETIANVAIRVGFTIVIAVGVQRLLYLAIGRVEKFLAHRTHDTRQALQRARTLSQILRSLVTFAIASFALIHVLAIFGWDVKPLLAGAGIVGVAIGFGSQTLVRDVISGLFILIENQYSVGDQIEINGQPATVEELTVRSTVLRDSSGFVHFVPNGEMRVVTNRSRDWNRLVVDVTVRAGVDVDRALEVCRDTVRAFNAEPQWRERLLDPAEVWGVEAVAGAEATIRSALRTRPGPAGQEAARELRRRLYHGLSGKGIETKPQAGASPAPAAAPPGGAAAARESGAAERGAPEPTEGLPPATGAPPMTSA